MKHFASAVRPQRLPKCDLGPLKAHSGANLSQKPNTVHLTLKLRSTKRETTKATASRLWLTAAAGGLTEGSWPSLIEAAKA